MKKTVEWKEVFERVAYWRNLIGGGDDEEEEVWGFLIEGRSGATHVFYGGIGYCIASLYESITNNPDVTDARSVCVMHGDPAREMLADVRRKGNAFRPN
jgi:hypothetical protein